MDEHTLRLLVIGLIMFSIFALVPIVMALLSHQQKMAELFAKRDSGSQDLSDRLSALERRLADLEARGGLPRSSQEELRARTANVASQCSDM